MTDVEGNTGGIAEKPVPSAIYSMGHGSLSPEQVLDLLRRFRIEQVVDVRAVPRSQHAPQFDKESLSPFLRIRRIKYLHLKSLGGLRRHAKPDSPNAGWRNASLRGFADYMMTGSFVAALNRLLRLAQVRVTAIICSEELPWRCHRLLISDALTVRGMRVIHLDSRGQETAHLLTSMAVVDGDRITYPPHPAGAGPVTPEAARIERAARE